MADKYSTITISGNILFIEGIYLVIIKREELLLYKKSVLIIVCIIMMFTVGCKKEVSIKIQDENLENVIRKMIDKSKGKIYVNMLRILEY